MSDTFHHNQTADRLAARAARHVSRAARRNAERREALAESLALSREALTRNLGTITEPDWRAQVSRYETRLQAA